MFFGGDAAFGPKNIIWSVEHGHQAAISIHKFCCGEPVAERLPRGVTLEQPQDGHARVVLQERIQRASSAAWCRTSGSIERFKKINIEVELGFTAEQAALEVQRCLNCDVQTVFAAKLCIECDACIDICPGRLPDHRAERHRGGAALAAQGAGDQSRAAAVRVGARCRRPGASWSRTRMCACTAACAPSAVPPPPGTCRSPPSRFRTPRMRVRHAEPSQRARSRERLRRQVRQRQRHRLGERQLADHEGHLPHGRPGHGQELLSLEHPGAADLVRDPRHARWLRRARRARRHHGGDECRDLPEGRARSRLRRLPDLRLHLAAQRAAAARRHHGHRRAAGASWSTRTSTACATASC